MKISDEPRLHDRISLRVNWLRWWLHTRHRPPEAAAWVPYKQPPLTPELIAWGQELQRRLDAGDTDD